ncbi:MAG: hypothetical protein J6S85_04555 [Methanobrevibacter sp.]|nr:hypothetical protein [Methanobrevibacter sp.]
MLDKQTTLYLYRGGSSSIDFDFTEFTFASGSKCVFTISSLCKKDKLLQFEFNESKTYTMIITDEFTSTLKDNAYTYNIVYIVGNERYPQCADSDIIVRNMVNAYGNNN